MQFITFFKAVSNLSPRKEKLFVYYILWVRHGFFINYALVSCQSETVDTNYVFH